jgi:aspartate-semialdehyde dehydrogenase
MAFNIAIVGATGLVGRMFIKVLEERNFPVKSIRLFASERSAGSSIDFKNEKIIVEKLGQNFLRYQYCNVSAGGAYQKNGKNTSTTTV